MAFDGCGNLTATNSPPPGAVTISAAMQPVISASTTDAALASLGLSQAMRPVVYASSLGTALNNLAAGGAVTNTPSVVFAPQGNPETTRGSLVVQATTGWSAGREFLGAFNLLSNTGSGWSSGAGTADKVALYAASKVLPVRLISGQSIR